MTLHRIVALGLVWSVLLMPSASRAQAQAQAQAPAPGPAPTLTGALPDGSTYAIDVPERWNGELLLYSHGYGGGADYRARTALTEVVRQRLLGEGFALAATAYAQDGWSVEAALRDQVAVLDVFAARVRPPGRTIAWGESMGGLVTLGLLQSESSRFAGGMSVCASVGGVVGMLNTSLDGAFVVRTLLAPDAGIELVNLTDERANNARIKDVLDRAQREPLGLARVALAAAVAQAALFGRSTPPPAPRDYAAQARNQAAAFMSGVITPRAPLEARAGGNFSWNTGIDYRRQLDVSGRMAAVSALYAAAGASLDDDLRRLNAAPRVSPDASAVAYMKRHVIPGHRLTVPLLTISSPGDELTTWAHESALREAVTASGDGAHLRQTFVSRPGHCVFSPEELLAGIGALRERITSGQWPDTSAPAMNTRAMSSAAAPATFIEATPPPFTRPCTQQTSKCDGEP